VLLRRQRLGAGQQFIIEIQRAFHGELGSIQTSVL
jgi:hypothetical protein